MKITRNEVYKIIKNSRSHQKDSISAQTVASVISEKLNIDLCVELVGDTQNIVKKYKKDMAKRKSSFSGQRNTDENSNPVIFNSDNYPPRTVNEIVQEEAPPRKVKRVEFKQLKHAGANEIR